LKAGLGSLEAGAKNSSPWTDSENWSKMIMIKEGVEGEKVVHVAVKDFDKLGNDLERFGLTSIDVKLASLEFVYLHSVVMHIVEYFGDLSILRKIAKGLDTTEALKVVPVEAVETVFADKDERLKCK
jgi:hypothetical protein